MAQMSRSVGTGLSRSRLIGAPSGLRYEFDLGPARLRGGRRFCRYRNRGPPNRQLRPGARPPCWPAQTRRPDRELLWD